MLFQVTEMSGHRISEVFVAALHEQFVGVQSTERQTRPVKSFICLVKDAVWRWAQFIVLSHTSDN